MTRFGRSRLPPLEPESPRRLGGYPNPMAKGPLLGRRVNWNAGSQIGTESLGLIPACSGVIGMALLVIAPNQRSMSPGPLCAVPADSRVTLRGTAGWSTALPRKRTGPRHLAAALKTPRSERVQTVESGPPEGFRRAILGLTGRERGPRPDRGSPRAALARGRPRPNPDGPFEQRLTPLEDRLFIPPVICTQLEVDREER